MIDPTTMARGGPRRFVVTCALLAAVPATACRPQPLTLPGKPRDPREVPGVTDDQTERREPATSSKRVASKRPPDTLVAEDGTRCVVPESRYERTHIGETVYCTWT